MGILNLIKKNYLFIFYCKKYNNCDTRFYKNICFKNIKIKNIHIMHKYIILGLIEIFYLIIFVCIFVIFVRCIPQHIFIYF